MTTRDTTSSAGPPSAGHGEGLQYDQTTNTWTYNGQPTTDPSLVDEREALTSGDWIDRIVLGIGEVGLTLMFVLLALALVYIGLTRLFGVRPLTTAASVAIPG